MHLPVLIRLMKRCLQADPHLRPSFTDVHMVLRQIADAIKDDLSKPMPMHFGPRPPPPPSLPVPSAHAASSPALGTILTHFHTRACFPFFGTQDEHQWATLVITWHVPINRTVVAPIRTTPPHLRVFLIPTTLAIVWNPPPLDASSDHSLRCSRVVIHRLRPPRCPCRPYAFLLWLQTPPWQLVPRPSTRDH
jgi:hypothetical protein